MVDVRVVTAEGFGEACLKALLDAVRDRDHPVIGLPTGNTPVALYERLAAAAHAGEVDISSWRPFAIDEYGGPRDHRCSNRVFFSKHWATIPGAAAVEQFDPGAQDIERECRRMGAALERAGGLTVSLLGIGMNGHLAFNEPGSAADSTVRRMELREETRRSAAACWGEDAPHWGLTLGLRELLGAERVIVMANGTSKAGVVAAAVEGPASVDLPASLSVRRHGTAWILDEAAASGLRG